MPIHIRRERPGDEKAIFDVNFLAFGQDAEPKVVDRLRGNCPEGVSLVAEDEGLLVGHILFTPAWIESGRTTVRGMGLAPLAVVPKRQRQGIGTALTGTGLSELDAAGVPYVVVIGHPGYYPRFGFEKASQYGFRCEYDEVPDEAFMMIVFQPRAIRGIRGTVKIRPEFAAAMQPAGRVGGG
ncbi:MAG: N-acetyltransferase [Anaerolineales bacterium]|nr:N-acetyltransferase [Anaerolineales bacterium]